MASRPQNIGIKAIEIYFPSQYVEQSELEKFDGVSTGKYTIGLGQTKMSFCDDREDIYSFSLTVVSKLLKKYDIDTNSIGRLEVGTETILDKSKSVKSVLMQLFGDNTNIEGVDTVNACYGGTNAVFNAVNWIESSAWDGRDAIVVAGDIALYAKGNARPTGGAGAVAMLIGPDAPIVFEPGLRGTYMQHAYDFYKPDLTSEYPYVDGHFSLTCYTKALDAAYRAYCKRERQFANGVNGVNGHVNGSESASPKTPLDRFDYLSFHAPNCKLVAKSYGRLLYHDYLADPENKAFAEVPAEFRDMDYEKSLLDKTVEKVFMGLTKKRFQERVAPGTQVATNVGNMYCASLWGGLAGLISNVDDATLQGKRIAMFSYGSGLAASFFSLRVNGSTEKMRQILDISNKLAARRGVPPETYDAMCDLRKKAHLQKDYTPQGDVSTIAPGTYYLVKVDDMFKRVYAIKE
ncbi:hydroxymethylglutaryl-CoA synthase [Thermothielavioides terrestris NRRL 8126]|uniref:Hydroxymethylglutaryl-CoA synthase n=1 Tax=Thermothielavioides terrestris (strain ATCC 38088 / NRRL 8126) TaxID=578455 RepID=G2QQU8_THETT|nr:hydroxymethylglutaryl-CoA synthase [Thermothielavioides terrestris NRRL 8126]AEO64107.1 hydroxymethylglutaryl-CoA synthase [Thermothielavioides terrestris NRRL 8126]